MTEYLELKATDCMHCYKCIRNCPVKAIRFSDNQAAIVGEECVLCGRCFVSCPQNAKRIHNDLPKAQDLVAGISPVYASLAPSFAANYPGATIETMGKVLAALGFAGAEETAQGATLVKQRYDDMVEAGESSVIISTCCHTVNMLVEQYYPEILPYMAAVASPMQAHARCLRARHPEAKVVFLGPCISKKAEAARYPDDVDCALTFEELDAWFAEAGIDPAASPGPPRKDERGKARLFPIAGGILRTMDKKNSEYDYIAVDGMENCIAALKDIAAGDIDHCFVEMSACSGSCIGGPAMSREAGIIRGTSKINAYARPNDFVVSPISEEGLTRQLQFNVGSQAKFSESAIVEVLRKIGKTQPEDELNCGSCGYDTCREKAVAVLSGKANLEMCLPYLMKKAQSFSDTIIKNTPNGIVVLNEMLEVQQINAAACRILNVKREEDVLDRNVICLLDPELFLQVLDGTGPVYDKRQYLTEYGRYVKLTVLYDEDSSLLIGIMRDITETETARVARREVADKTIRVTDEVIDRQMRTVQEIASLLGETAAETKIALTKLKETLRND